MDFKERQMRLPDVRIEAAEMIIASGMVPDSRVSSALFPVEIKTISKPFFRRAGANTGKSERLPSTIRSVSEPILYFKLI